MACHLCNGKRSIVGQYFVADLITIGSRAESTIFLDLGGAEMLAWGPRPWGRRCGWHGVAVESFGIFWYRFFCILNREWEGGHLARQESNHDPHQHSSKCNATKIGRVHAIDIDRGYVVCWICDSIEKGLKGPMWFCVFVSAFL